MKNIFKKIIASGITCIVLALQVAPVLALPAGGTGTLSSFQMVMSDPNTSATNVGHQFLFDPPSTTAIDKVEITYHDGTDNPASAAQYLAATASFVSTSLWGSGTFNTSINLAGREIVITRNEGALPPNAGSVNVALNGITNAATEGTYFVTIATMAGATYIDAGTSAFVLQDGLAVSTEVAASFSMTVSDNGVKDNSSDDIGNTAVIFGNLSSGSTSNPVTGQGVDGHAINVTTNAANGYSIQVLDTENGLAVSGAAGVTSADRSVNDAAAPSNNVIFDYEDTSPPDFDDNPPIAGQEAYYLRLTAGGNGAIGLNEYHKLTGQTPKTLINASGPVVNDAHTILYYAQVHASSPPGFYVDELTYIATPNF